MARATTAKSSGTKAAGKTKGNAVKKTRGRPKKV